MTKKVLIISASPRRRGNSDILCDQFAVGARDAGHDVEKIFLRDKDINYCTGCYACEINKGICAIQDDVPEILEKIIQTDVLVLSTPVYFYCMNAQLKTLIDRTVARYTEIKDKDSYLIATAGEKNMKAMTGTLSSYYGFLDCLEDVRDAGVVLGHGLHEHGESGNSIYMQEAYEKGRAIK